MMGYDFLGFITLSPPMLPKTKLLGLHNYRGGINYLNSCAWELGGSQLNFRP
jgi:hypothetical protein